MLRALCAPSPAAAYSISWRKLLGPHPTSTLPSAPVPHPMGLSVGSVNSWNPPCHPNPGSRLQEASRKAWQMDPRTPPFWGLHTSHTCALCMDPHRQAQILSWIWGKDPEGRMGDLGGRRRSRARECRESLLLQGVWATVDTG